MSDIWIVPAIFCFISTSMIIGIIVGIYKFRLVVKEENVIITKRYPTLVIMICLASINLLFLEIFWQILSVLSVMNKMVLSRVWHALFSLSMPLFAHLFTLRFWLVYYDLCWANFNSHSQWIQHINQQITDNNFWLVHRHKWGNVAYCKRFMLKMYIIIASISLVTYQIGLFEGETIQYHGTYAAMAALNALFYVLPLIFSIILFLKSPKFEDHLFIQYEFRINIIILSIALLAYFIWAAIISVPHIINQRQAQWIGSILLRIPETISFTSTFLIMYKLKKTETNINHTNAVNEERKIENILENYDEFQSFMKYLMQEFAMESALAFLEFVQFKYYLKKHADINEEVVVVLNERDFPSSFIVYQSQSLYDDVLLRSIKIAVLLHDKYIAYNSILEINISYKSREHFNFEIEKLRERVRANESFTDMNVEKLFTFFDDVIHEMILLLNPAYYRFNHADDYT